MLKQREAKNSVTPNKNSIQGVLNNESQIVDMIMNNASLVKCERSFGEKENKPSLLLAPK